jgi:hypothetical protein
MIHKKLIAASLITLTTFSIFPANADYLRPDTSMVDGIKVNSSTRVQAGKYFQVKLTARKSKINTICWLDWELSRGFAFPKDFRMTRGVATVKMLPVKPGSGVMSFYCGVNRSNAQIGGYSEIYIAP